MLYGADKGPPCVDTVGQHRHSLVHKPTGRSPLPSPKPSDNSGALVGAQTLTFPVNGAHSEPAVSGGRPPVEGQSSSCRV